MKIRAKVNGQVIDISDEGARKLIDAGIYDAVDETSTPVEPMTTESMPTKPKRVK